MSVQTEKITRERLAGWTQRLKEENATPLIMLGCGHDHKKGQLVVLVPEGVDDDLIIGSLLYALNAIKPGLIPPHEGGRVSVTPKGL